MEHSTRAVDLFGLAHVGADCSDGPLLAHRCCSGRHDQMTAGRHSDPRYQNVPPRIGPGALTPARSRTTSAGCMAEAGVQEAIVSLADIGLPGAIDGFAPVIDAFS